MSKALILVPARYESSRFPGKPLAKINGRSMISYVIENCAKSGFDFAIVTDHDDIEAEVKKLEANVVRVDDPVSTGSERIALAYERNFKGDYDLVVNMQGDEPLMTGEAIQKIIKAHSESEFAIFTGVKKRVGEESDYQNANIVKAAYSEMSKECFYFTRSSVPFYRNQDLGAWYQHIGIYSYRADDLMKYNELKPTALEQAESLEQLRALENGMRIGAVPLDIHIIGVDTPEDIPKVEGVLK